MSTDHDWGPTVQLFLRDEDADQAEPIREMLRRHLPHTFCGYPVDAEPVPDEDGTTVPKIVAEGPVEPPHRAGDAARFYPAASGLRHRPAHRARGLAELVLAIRFWR